MQSCPTVTQVPAMLVVMGKKSLAPQVSEWESLGYYSRVSSLNVISQDPSCEEQTNRVTIQPDLAAMGLGMMRG